MATPMTRAAMKTWLAGVPLFASLGDAELETLAAAATSVAVPRHGRVFEQDAPADCCFVLTAGEARVVLATDGDTEVPLGTVTPPMLVGELALLDGSPRSASLVATQPCRFIRIPASAFDRLRANAVFEKALTAHVAATLREANDQVRGMSTSPAIARVAWCLGRIARREGRRDGAAILIPKKPHQELAEMAGCTRETVTRALNALKRKKCVSWSGGHMRLEIDGLQRYLRGELRLPRA